MSEQTGMIRPPRSRDGQGLTREVGEMLRSHTDWDLMSAMHVHHDLREVSRFYSSRPGDYPVGGRKPFNPRILTDTFCVEGRIHRCNTREEVTACYSNDPGAAIYSASMNIPVLWEERLVGMLNLLKLDSVFDEVDETLVSDMAALALPAFLDKTTAPAG